jgi:hypothetical protein
MDKGEKPDWTIIFETRANDRQKRLEILVDWLEWQFTAMYPNNPTPARSIVLEWAGRLANLADFLAISYRAQFLEWTAGIIQKGIESLDTTTD